MKCIRSKTRHDDIRRVPDAVARAAVKTGLWHLVAKHCWKRVGRP